jgi:hypothetical protein
VTRSLLLDALVISLLVALERPDSPFLRHLVRVLQRSGLSFVALHLSAQSLQSVDIPRVAALLVFLAQCCGHRSCLS